MLTSFLAKLFFLFLFFHYYPLKKSYSGLGWMKLIYNYFDAFSLQNLNQQQRPHTRLEIINGVLHQKLIFVESPTDILVKSTDCVIFNDGSKSSGCTREEFKPYVSVNFVMNTLPQKELI